MPIFSCYRSVFNTITVHSGKVCQFILLIALPFNAVHALNINMQVEDGLGGRITNVTDNSECLENCIIQSFPNTLVSLFAIPDKGFRFLGWDGNCLNAIGPLCTFKSDGNVNVIARFAKTKVPTQPIKALLLLHDVDEKHTTWNKLAEQRFSNRCPVVYGGVVLEKDSYDSSNNVYCYRIRFGYYDLLNQSQALQRNQEDNDASGLNPNLSSTELGYEVQAAILGILNRHPNVSLTLVGHKRAELAARSFLQTATAKHTNIVNVLVLQPLHVTTQRSGIDAPSPRFEPTLFKLATDPEHARKISAALSQLTKSWWTAR